MVSDPRTGRRARAVQVHNVTKQDPKLFYAFPWSYGTIGFLTAITVKLIRVKPYVRVEYEPTATGAELTRRLSELAALGGGDAPDFLEATLYDKDRAVIQAGYFRDTPAGAPINPINSFYKPFYFRHVETVLHRGAFAESIPLKHFLHRFTRSIFWEIEDMIPFSNHPVYRCLWGWMGAPEVSLLKLFQGPVIRRASVYGEDRLCTRSAPHARAWTATTFEPAAQRAHCVAPPAPRHTCERVGV